LQGRLFMYDSEYANKTPKEGNMVKLQAFRVAAREAGFVEVREAGGGSTLWLKKGTPDTAQGTFQRMCIDSLTKSVTVYWMTAFGKLDSKTFRGVPALQEWFKLSQEVIVKR